MHGRERNDNICSLPPINAFIPYQYIVTDMQNKSFRNDGECDFIYIYNIIY